MADLDEMLSGGAETRAPDTHQEQDNPDQGQHRDDAGRFAPEQPEQGQQEQPGQQQTERPPEGYVPHQALHAAREEAKGYRERFTALEAQNQALTQQFQALMGRLQAPQPQPPAEAPDWYTDPNAALQHNLQGVISPLQQQLQQQREGFSQMMAVEKHGAETVQTATAELVRRVQANPQGMKHIYDGIMASPHPYGALVEWHQQQSALSRYGSDPEAYINAEIERRLAAQGHQAQPHQAAPHQQQPAAQQPMPSSFAGARSAGPRGGQAVSGPLPLSQIMGR